MKMRKTMLKIYSDGGSRGNPGPAASAFVVFENGKMLHKDAKFIGEKTNNYAEYFAVLMALGWLVKKFNQKNVTVAYYLDSELVVNQLKGNYKVRSKNLAPLVSEAFKMMKSFSGRLEYFAVRREKNTISDKLVNESLDENLQ